MIRKDEHEDVCKKEDRYGDDYYFRILNKSIN